MIPRKGSTGSGAEVSMRIGEAEQYAIAPGYRLGTYFQQCISSILGGKIAAVKHPLQYRLGLVSLSTVFLLQKTY
jgi:hypothetical protein